MFLGTYLTHFSGRRRVILPKKFREETRQKGLVLTKGLDGCIFGFDKNSWDTEAKKQLEIPIVEEKGRTLRRFIFSEAEVVGFDKQGRFVIPNGLILFAKIKANVLIIGAGDHFEIWDPKKWKEYKTSAQKGLV